MQGKKAVFDPNGLGSANRTLISIDPVDCDSGLRYQDCCYLRILYCAACVAALEVTYLNLTTGKRSVVEKGCHVTCLILGRSDKIMLH